MPLPLQTRLLRVLAEGEFFRVGGRELIRVDVRVIAATHQDLERAGRRRHASAPTCCIASTWCACTCRRCASAATTCPRWPSASSPRPRASSARRPSASPKPALERLRAHDWPGNVRELENLCWRLAALAPGDTIGTAELDMAFAHATAGDGAGDEDWEAALARWAREQLAAGAADLHAAGARALRPGPARSRARTHAAAIAAKPRHGLASAATR